MVSKQYLEKRKQNKKQFQTDKNNVYAHRLLMNKLCQKIIHRNYLLPMNCDVNNIQQYNVETINIKSEKTENRAMYLLSELF